MQKKTQILYVHGAETFKSRKDYLQYLATRSISLEPRMIWSREYLDKKLGRGFEIIRLRMPLSENAQYEDWKIHFERYIPLLKNDCILIGNSLGGIFLARYLSENVFPKKLQAVFLVCPPFEDIKESGFKLKSDLSLLQKSTKNLHLLFSGDDEVVPVAHAEKYRKKLPGADIVIYPSYGGHFQVAEFPEIVKMIKADVKK